MLLEAWPTVRWQSFVSEPVLPGEVFPRQRRTRAGSWEVKALRGCTTVNIPGCPTHPDWIVWCAVQLLSGNPIPLDSYGLPTQFFSTTVHDQCPQNGNTKVTTFGVDNNCLMDLGCWGPMTMANRPSQKWNNQVNWCVDANAPCIGSYRACISWHKPFLHPGHLII